MTTFKKIFLSALCVATLTHSVAQNTLSTQVSELCSSAFKTITHNPWVTGLSLGTLGLAALVYKCYTPYTLLELATDTTGEKDMNTGGVLQTLYSYSFKSFKQLSGFEKEAESPIKGTKSTFYAFWNRQPIDIKTGKLLTDSIQINLHLAMYAKNLRWNKQSKEKQVANSSKKETVQKEIPQKGFWANLKSRFSVENLEAHKKMARMERDLKRIGNDFDALTEDIKLMNAKIIATKLYPSKKGHYHIIALHDGATDKQGNTVIDANHIITYTTEAEVTQFATNVVKNNKGCKFVSNEKQKEAGHYFFYFKKGQTPLYPLQNLPASE